MVVQSKHSVVVAGKILSDLKVFPDLQRDEEANHLLCMEKGTGE